MTFFCRRLRIFLLFFCLLTGMTACRNGFDHGNPSVRFAVVSDPHLYATELGTAGSEFVSVVEREQKLFSLSRAIFAQIVTQLLEQRPRVNFVLIPGDLTKDGELLSHQQMVAQLERLERGGIQVFVIPGNHDINNPEARGYNEAGSFPVPVVTAPQFRSFYGNFGYKQTIAQDSASLSYISEPAPGLWLVAIDSCRYGENSPELSQIGGRIQPETLDWLKNYLALAREQNKKVIGMLHHGLTEHYRGQGEHFPDFLIEDWADIGPQLAQAGLNLVFSGHFHAQDVTRVDWEDGSFLIDVETGSSASYPNSYRIVDFNLAESTAQLESFQIQSLPGDDQSAGVADLAALSYDFSIQTLAKSISTVLTQRLDLPAEKIAILSPALTAATLAHVAGDELPMLSTFKAATKYAQDPDADLARIGLLLLTLWHDLPPGDNQVSLSLLPQTAGVSP
jgi:hypothetical protein